MRMNRVLLPLTGADWCLECGKDVVLYEIRFGIDREGSEFPDFLICPGCAERLRLLLANIARESENAQDERV